MGVLTEEMTHLCAHIVNLRKSRQALCTGLTHSDVARKAAVQEMRATLTSARLDTARKDRQERRAFRNQTQRAVGGQRQAMKADLDGARRAWAGPST